MRSHKRVDFSDCYSINSYYLHQMELIQGVVASYNDREYAQKLGKGLKMPLTYPKWFKNALLPPFDFTVYVPDLLFFGDSITTRPERSTSIQAECLAKGMMKLGVLTAHILTPQNGLRF
ncbi:hypothetical protein KY289_006264 [Solanum tuberosum]|nr:hypothetical protein KY284_005959 [Solanum tuberosum]KAH0723220.1 hypothetical protein KY289_006264 [Solanum tuberosum]